MTFPRSRLARPISGVLLLLLVAAGCNNSGQHLAEDLARTTLSKYQTRKDFLVSGTGRQAIAMLPLAQTDERNACPWGDIEPVAPKGFFPGAPAHQQFGCTVAQAGPEMFGGKVDGSQCDILLLPDERMYSVQVFCGL